VHLLLISRSTSQIQSPVMSLNDFTHLHLSCDWSPTNSYFIGSCIKITHIFTKLTLSYFIIIIIIIIIIMHAPLLLVILHALWLLPTVYGYLVSMYTS